jgi:hypothetical protein
LEAEPAHGFGKLRFELLRSDAVGAIDMGDAANGDLIEQHPATLVRAWGCDKPRAQSGACRVLAAESEEQGFR